MCPLVRNTVQEHESVGPVPSTNGREEPDTFSVQRKVPPFASLPSLRNDMRFADVLFCKLFGVNICTLFGVDSGHANSGRAVPGQSRPCFASIPAAGAAPGARSITEGYRSRGRYSFSHSATLGG